jgi:hypothetical protein
MDMKKPRPSGRGAGPNALLVLVAAFVALVLLAALTGLLVLLAGLLLLAALLAALLSGLLVLLAALVRILVLVVHGASLKLCPLSQPAVRRVVPRATASEGFYLASLFDAAQRRRIAP